MLNTTIPSIEVSRKNNNFTTGFIAYFGRGVPTLGLLEKVAAQALQKVGKAKIEGWDKNLKRT
jgi:hypothetical protein